jgi:hypothetical protein
MDALTWKAAAGWDINIDSWPHANVNGIKYSIKKKKQKTKPPMSALKI